MPGFKVGDIGPDSVSGRPKTYYSYTWEIPFIFDASGLRGPLVYCREVTLPTFTVGQEQVKGASLVYKYANDVTWDDIHLTWYDTEGMLEILKRWRERVWTVDKGLAAADDYKRRTLLLSTLPDGTAAQRWELVNSWPSSIRNGDLTYTQSDVKVVDVTVTYDWAVETPPG